MKQHDGFIKVCKDSELKEKIGRKFFVDDVDVALFKVDGQIYALNNVCIHQKAAIIYDGFIDDGKVTCPSHGWQFNLKSGKVLHGAKGLDSYEVKVVGDDIFVKVFKKKLKW